MSKKNQKEDTNQEAEGEVNDAANQEAENAEGEQENNEEANHNNGKQNSNFKIWKFLNLLTPHSRFYIHIMCLIIRVFCFIQV